MLIVDVSCLNHGNSPSTAPTFTTSLGEGILNFHDLFARVFATLCNASRRSGDPKYIAVGAAL
jgi:hypothetical protein